MMMTDAPYSPSNQPSPQILIVDDRDDNVALLRMILVSQGYRVLTASDGPEALEIVRQTPPDLILLDVMMPRMSGYEVVQTIRADSTNAYIPIMLITAKQDLSDKIKGLDIGADDFLPKPVQSTELIAKIRALLRLKAVQDELIRERNKNALLYHVGQQLSDTLDVDQLIGHVVPMMVEMLGATHGSVIIHDQKYHLWREIVAHTAFGVAPLFGDQVASEQVIRHGLAGHALRTRAPQLVSDTRHDERWLPLPGATEQIRTALAIPLVRDQIELGVLTLMHHEPQRFSHDQLPLLTTVAGQISTALHNASLYSQLKAAEASREYFVHMLTHDLRAPLTGIAGCLHVIRMNVEKPVNVQFVEMAQRACDQQEGLISDILHVYQAESGSLVLEKQQFCVRELQAALTDQLAGAAVERGIELWFELPDQAIVGDRRKLERVLINLASNAIKFTRKGGVSIVATIEPDGSALFQVRDTGAGIPPEDVAHVFDRFYRAEQQGSKPGSGLGLNFCREVVLAHSGHIWVESEVGQGTTVFFTLPSEVETA